MNNIELTGIRWVIALIWLVTAALSFGLYPVEDSLALLQKLPLAQEGLLLVLYAGAALDLAMGVLTLVYPRRWLWKTQLMLITGYTLLATLLVPAYWLHPFGPLLKNFAVMALLWLLYRSDTREHAKS